MFAFNEGSTAIYIRRRPFAIYLTLTQTHTTSDRCNSGDAECSASHTYIHTFVVWKEFCWHTCEQKKRTCMWVEVSVRDRAQYHRNLKKILSHKVLLQSKKIQQQKKSKTFPVIFPHRTGPWELTTTLHCQNGATQRVVGDFLQLSLELRLPW